MNNKHHHNHVTSGFDGAFILFQGKNDLVYAYLAGMLRVSSVIGDEQSGHTGGVPAPAEAVRRAPDVSRRIHALQASSVHFHTGTLMRGSSRVLATDEAVRADPLPGPGLLLTRVAVPDA